MINKNDKKKKILTIITRVQYKNKGEKKVKGGHNHILQCYYFQARRRCSTFYTHSACVRVLTPARARKVYYIYNIYTCILYAYIILCLLFLRGVCFSRNANRSGGGVVDVVREGTWGGLRG